MRPGGLDQLIQLGRGLEIPGVLQDLGASLAVLPEDVAGVACDVPRQEEAGSLRVALDVLRRTMPILEELVDVPAVEAPSRDLGTPRSRSSMTARASGALAAARSSVAVSNTKLKFPRKDRAQRSIACKAPAPA